jgi:P27 family predicted phage terminase small subunit
MKRGPKPKPFLLKVQEGNRGRRKLIPGLEVPPSRFEPPMPLTGVALREWHRLLAVAHWLRETESAAIADRCLCMQRVIEAEEDVVKFGFTIRGRHGEVANPSVRIARAYRSAMQRWDAELGLLPSSRAALAPDDQDAGFDALEAALCRGG